MGIRHLLTLMVLPPGLQFLMLGLALLLWPLRRGLSRIFAWIAMGSLLLLSLPTVKNHLLAGLEVYPPIQDAVLQTLDPQKTAIVILSGGIETGFREYAEPVVSSSSMRRAWYGALLHQKTQLPILVSGGDVVGSGLSEAQAMANRLGVLGIKAEWVEGLSLNTWQNAEHSSDYLKRDKVDTVILVTDAWHMKRALYSFEGRGLRLLPAPTGFLSGEEANQSAFPNAEALSQSATAIREYLGLLVYRVGFQSPQKE